MQFKAVIKKMAKEKNISPQLVMQNYMLERLLERISLSNYHNNFIFKGGFLISSIVGLSSRATMDLDTTIKGFTLTHDSITAIFKEICDIEIDDDITETEQKKILLATKEIIEKQDSYSIHVKHLTKSEIQSLRESKKDAYHRMMAMS